MQHVNLLLSGLGLVQLCFRVIFMQVTMILEFPAGYCHLARGIAQVYLLYFFTNFLMGASAPKATLRHVNGTEGSKTSRPGWDLGTLTNFHE